MPLLILTPRFTDSTTLLWEASQQLLHYRLNHFQPLAASPLELTQPIAISTITIVAVTALTVIIAIPVSVRIG